LNRYYIISNNHHYQENGGTPCPSPETQVCNTEKCSPFVCGEQPFGDFASHFNTFLTGNFLCRGSVTQGRLAVGGNIDVEGNQTKDAYHL
jgi:hypothetical protein